MSQGPLYPNLSQKVQKEVSQMANRKLSCAMLYRWFKCKLKPPKNQEISWRTDFDQFERHIYDKIAMANAKTEKSKKPGVLETTWFCKAFQKPEGCTKTAPHNAKVGNSFRTVHHICANCWLKDKIKAYHPDSSQDCPYKEA